MILKFGTKNFFSFKNWMEIDFTFNDKVAKEFRSVSNVARVMCLKGANASGKTNALRALSFLRSFCTDSFNEKPDANLNIDAFFYNDQPTDFFVEFRNKGIDFTYEVQLTNKVILSEKISRKEKRKVVVLHRINNQIIKNVLYDSKREIILRGNASVISTAKQYEIKELDVIYDFFANISVNVGYLGFKHDFLDENMLAAFYNDRPDVLEFVKKKLSQFDTGIKNIEINDYTNNKNEKIYFTIFHHFGENIDDDNMLLYHCQSSGTKSLFLYLAIYYLTLNSGGVLVLDEFDINLHPAMLPHLINIFEDPQENPLGAQLLFSTHNADVIDLMGKYRTYLFNKEKGESYCYRLDELDPSILRNDRSITPIYKSGRIGGIPQI
jgi:AAA15 family ATPase/GTPase